MSIEFDNRIFCNIDLSKMSFCGLSSLENVMRIMVKGLRVIPCSYAPRGWRSEYEI